MIGAISPREERAPVLLARPRIVGHIVEPGVLPIVLVIAPAGYGKSTALDECMSALEGHCIRFQVASEHATLAAFVRGFAEALDEVDVGDGSARIEASERAIRDRLGTYYGAIIVDGLELAQGNAEVIHFLVATIECTKARVRWILASRSTLGLPIGTWLAYGDCDLAVDALDLRFSSKEVHEAVRALEVEVESDEIDAVVRYTEGWPAAINVAMRAWTRPLGQRNLCETIREASHRFLEEQVYAALEDQERDLLAIAAVLPEIDVKVLDLAGFERALHLLDTVRARTGLLREESSGLYRCQALFLDFLRRRIDLSGPRVRESVYIRAARALEAAEEIEPALDAYVKASSRDDLLRVLERYGFDLLERGRTEAASRAIDALDDPTRRGHARILALRGVLQSLAGNPIRAEAYLRRSLLKAKNDRDLVGFARLRLAPLIANYGGDVGEILMPAVEDQSQPVTIRAEALSLLATGRAMMGDEAAARDALARVEELLVDIDLDATRARVLQRIGVAAMHIGENSRARQALAQAADLASELNLHSIASRAWSALSNLMCHQYDDVYWQLTYAQHAADAATKSGDVLDLQTALIQVAAAEMRRGNSEHSAAAEARLVSLSSDPKRAHLLVAYRALRLAWEGRFGEAHQYLVPCWNRMHYEFDKLVCGAQAALFLALDGRRESSIGLTSEMLVLAGSLELNGLFRVRSVALAMLLCAIAEIVNGRATHAGRVVQKIDLDSVDQVISLAGSIAEQVTRTAEAPERLPDIRTALEKLTMLGYADVARVLQAVWVVLEKKSSKAAFNELTPAEVLVIQLLGEGLSTKEIAARHGRSVNTVRAHIANAIGKLRCHGRSQAVAVARRLEIIP